METIKNSIGEDIPTYTDSQSLVGFLDLLAGDTQRTYNSKLQETTHVFICDFVPIDDVPENSRFIINNEIYEITLIDNPMNLNQHLEIFLKYLGGDADV